RAPIWKRKPPESWRKLKSWNPSKPEGVPEVKRLALFSFSFLLFSLAALGQNPNQDPNQRSGAPRTGPQRVTGTVTNGTINKPAGGDEVILLKPGQSMEEVARTKTDARGQFTLAVPEDGMPIHAIRVKHQGVDFLKPLRAGMNS